LYSIAWETGRDYRDLAKWNHIPPPYTIKPGQSVRVKPPARESVDRVKTRPAGKAAAGSPPTKPPSNQAAQPKTTAAATGRKSRQLPTSEANRKSDKPTAAARPVATADATAATAKHPVKKNSTMTATAAPIAVSKRTATQNWRWPADGQVLNRYSESDSKGLDIAGARGVPVLAAESGRVVYQGSGLRGYGQLIIIKHSDDFLSAYAHNDRIYVKEGDAVKRGQKIADMGSTGTDRVKLHFEIRRQGVPVDPLKYLPRR
jgi:lipoprotein NlpD